MAPTPIPAPLPLWAKALLQLTPFVAGYLYDLVTHSADVDEDVEWRRVHCMFTRGTPTGTTEDQMMCTFDIVNITGGAVDSSWTTTDYTQCETALDAFWTAYAPSMYLQSTLTSYRWYRRSFNPYTTSKPFADSGPPQRVTAKSIVGTGSSALPPQVAITATELTAFPHHWGRVYLPWPGQATTGSFGRIGSSTITAVANAYQALATSLQGNGFFPVVPVTQVNKVPARGLLTVGGVQVDDVYDVQRSRRGRQPAIRTVRP